MCPGSPLVLQEVSHSENHTFDENCEFMDCLWELKSPYLEKEVRFNIDIFNKYISRKQVWNHIVLYLILVII